MDTTLIYSQRIIALGLHRTIGNMVSRLAPVSSRSYVNIPPIVLKSRYVVQNSLQRLHLIEVMPVD